MKTLVDIFNRIGNTTAVDRGCNDKGGQIHTYTETYDKLFAPFQKGCSFLEIGLALGDSIDLFDEYFENSDIAGVDISVVFTPKKYKNNVSIIEADATKANFLKDIKGKTFDIVIDDGSHMSQDQIDTFNLLKGSMNKGGIYVIEDILALDQERSKFERLHSNCEIIDMRSNGRFDNVLIVYRF
jgi:23S rRNA U2552 (ribose-2'-O)-methylase RlmE/FtsJ